MSDISPRRKIAGRVLLGAAVLALPLTASISYAESMTTPNAPPAPIAAPAVTPPVALTNAAVPAPPAPAAIAMTLQTAPEAPEAEKNVYVIEDVDTDDDGKTRKVRKHKIVIKDGEVLTHDERGAMIKELREELAEAEVEIKGAMKEVRVAMLEMDQDGMKTTVKTTCKAGGGAGETTNQDGQRVVHICTSEVMANALAGIKEARAAIAKDGQMDKEIRSEVLKALDEKIETWGKEG